ncbi:MAG: MBL fold metallo-hydrolase [Gemmataceae bacterium]|nr:MBL fold metallo-hydrolase [Gemmataceae bacterium]
MNLATPAASVLLSHGPGSREVYAILRGRQLRFFGGFWAFPGGKLAEQDLHHANGDPLHARRLAACRELFEEVGVLIARDDAGNLLADSSQFEPFRQSVLDETLPFAEFLARNRWTIRDTDFPLIGEITTPKFTPVRFATTFFSAQLPSGQVAHVVPGELELGEWTTPEALLARWHTGEVLVTPPSAMSLEILAGHPIDEAPARLGPTFRHLAAGAIHPIYLAPCVQMIPLRTVALPPSTHTSAVYIGNGPRYLIDPGPREADEQQRLFDILDEQRHIGRGMSAIVLSHHHPDHVDAATICADRYNVPIWAHSRTAALLEGTVRVDLLLHNGDRLDLGTSPADGRPWHLDVLHTPGHASGHLAFFEPVYRILMACDMISTVTSMVIAPPDGNIPDYLASLRRLRELPTRILLPAHGAISTDPTKLIAAAIEHRGKRECQLLDTLSDTPIDIDALTALLYRGTPESLMRFARAQVHAGLLKLQQEGRAEHVNVESWRNARR